MRRSFSSPIGVSVSRPYPGEEREIPDGRCEVFRLLFVERVAGVLLRAATKIKMDETTDLTRRGQTGRRLKEQPIDGDEQRGVGAKAEGERCENRDGQNAISR